MLMQSRIKYYGVMDKYPVSRLSEEEFLRIAEINVAALNAATADLPADKVRNYHGLVFIMVIIIDQLLVVSCSLPSNVLFS